MARVRKTPSIGLSGIYSAIAPFILSNEFTYECIAIRRFLDVEKMDIRVLETYYLPHELTSVEYAEDEEMGACIITLRRSDGLLVYLPDTYISSYPMMEGVPHVRLSLLIDCGIVRTGLDVSFVEAEIISLIRQALNPPSVNISRILLPVKNSISVVDQDSLEAARVAGTSMNKTDFAKWKAAETEINNLKQIIADQNQKLIDAGIPV